MMNALRILAFVAALVLNTSVSFAGEPLYSYSTIPENMKTHANAVIRDFHEEINIKGPGEVYITTRTVVTILNEKGKKYGQIAQSYDNFRKITSIDGRLFDKNGDELQKLRQKSIKDYGLITGSLVDDSRMKTFDFDYSVYPYTCVFEIVTRFSYSFLMPNWAPKPAYDCSVEKADLEVMYPKDFPLRYRTFHIGKQPVVATEGGTNKLTLSLEEIAAGHKPDEFTPLENFYFPTVIFAADRFEIDDKEGSMATWSDFGRFVYELNVNRDDLPADVIAAVHKLTDTCHSEISKISVLYEYLKKNTRYVSIQLGIGGWQTFEAKFVAEKGYGDCKALSNYMKGLLKAAGITSYQALVYGGDRENRMMMHDFPCNEFNHVILCVPNNNDTTWLECTSKTLPAGYMSSFTANRNVLLLTPQGGFEVRTPDYNLKTNLAVRAAEIYLDERDELKATINLKYTGYFWDREHGNVVDGPKSKIDNYLNRKFSIATYTVGDYKIENDLSGQVPCLYESIPITGTASAGRSGKNLFLSPNILPLQITQPDSYEPRKHPFHIAHSYSIVDTVRFHLYGEYTMSAPFENKIDQPFAAYGYKAEMENSHTLKVTRQYTQQEGDYPAELFAEYIKLSKEVNINAAADKIILTAKD